LELSLVVHVSARGTARTHSANARRAAVAAFETIPRRMRRALLGEESAFLVVAFVGDRAMRELNRTYRRKDKTTDVLSFSRFDDPVPMPLPPGEPRPVGEVLVSLPMARRQAKAYRTTLREEIARLVVHGTLHVFGYDHERSTAEARVMFRLQAAALRRWRR
jgi:probable rRNA maturation factor